MLACLPALIVSQLIALLSKLLTFCEQPFPSSGFFFRSPSVHRFNILCSETLANTFATSLPSYFTVFTKGEKPMIRTSNRSPDLIGPTPLGVPVRMISPGNSVIFVDMKLTSW